MRAQRRGRGRGAVAAIEGVEGPSGLERGGRAWQARRVSRRRESRRLSRVFGALVLTLGPVASMQACSDAMTSAATPIEDATAEADGVAAAADGRTDEDVVDAQLPPIDGACTLFEELRDAGPDADADADPGCRYVLPCGVPDGSAFHVEGCALYSGPSSSPDAALGCFVPEGLGCMSDAYVPAANGSLTFDCLDCFGGSGRRPSGLLSPRSGRARGEARQPVRARSEWRTDVGEYFARMAYGEAASVHAFAELEADLVRWGAPAELIAAASRSARDEVRHARLMAHRARACGGAVEVLVPRVRRRTSRSAARSLESIARENAVEGCINETFGALQLRWQATHARAAADRRLFARIAVDETRHAALSWLVAQWAEPLLDARARRRVAAARSRATRALRKKLEAPAGSQRGERGERGASALDRAVGRPLPEQAVALLDGLIASLVRVDAAADAAADASVT